MSTLETRLAKLEAQRTGSAEIQVVIIDDGRYYPKDYDTTGPGLSEDEYRAMFPIGPDDRVIEVKYADMADVQSAARGYLAADTPKALELKVAELSPVFGAAKGYTGVSPGDWNDHDANAAERATPGAN